MSTLKILLKKYGMGGLVAYSKLKINSTCNVRLPGLKYPLTLRKDTSDVASFKSIFAYEEYKFQFPKKVKFIIDAGANVGLSTAYFAMKFPQALIVSIEAQKENFGMLNHNTKQFPHVKTIHAGVWSKTAMLNITNAEADETGFMVGETSADDPDAFNAISIPAIMEQFQMPYIDLVKIDIEGAEKEVLENNTEWIEKSRIIILELHDRKKKGCSQAFFKSFSKYNFECYPFGQNFLLLNKNYDADPEVPALS